jgi:hypothetical protein
VTRRASVEIERVMTQSFVQIEELGFSVNHCWSSRGANASAGGLALGSPCVAR